MSRSRNVFFAATLLMVPLFVFACTKPAEEGGGTSVGVVGQPVTGGEVGTEEVNEDGEKIRSLEDAIIEMETKIRNLELMNQQLEAEEPQPPREMVVAEEFEEPSKEASEDEKKEEPVDALKETEVTEEDMTADSDGDGTPDVKDNCANAKNLDQKDTDEDGFGDVCDDDVDGDEIPNEEDNCPMVANAGQEDGNNDDLGDACDPERDWDKDGILNEADNCPNNSNVTQVDQDMDKVGDPCDDDVDGDGIPNERDNCQYVYNPDQIDKNFSPGGDECDAEGGDGIVTSPVRSPITGGFLLGVSEEARIRAPSSLALIKAGSKKLLFIGDYGNTQLWRATLNDDGTVEAVDFNTYIPYITGMVATPDQKNIYMLAHSSYSEKNAAGKTITYSTVAKVELDGAGNFLRTMIPATDGKGNHIKYDQNYYYVYYNFNPAISPDGKFLYIPVGGTNNQKPKIDCLDIGSGAAVTTLLEVPFVPYGVAYVDGAVGSVTEGRLYIAENTKIHLLKVNGCSVVGPSPVSVIEGVKPAGGLVASPDGKSLYFAASTVDQIQTVIMAVQLNEAGGAASAPVVIAGGKKDIWSGLITPRGMALDPETNRIYVADWDASTVKMIQPNGLSVSRITNLVGLADLDDSQKKIMGNGFEKSFIRPYGITAGPEEKDGTIDVFVSNNVSNTITLVKYDVKSGTPVAGSGILRVGVPFMSGYGYSPWRLSGPYGLAYYKYKSPNTETERKLLYVADYSSHSIMCFRLDLPYEKGVTTVALGTYLTKAKQIVEKDVVTSITVNAQNNKVRLPIDVTVSDDGRHVYWSNYYNVIEDYLPTVDGNLSHVEVEPETCRPITDPMNIIEAYKAGSRPTGIKFHKIGEKWFAYWTSVGGNDYQLKRIALDPATGMPPSGAVTEVIAGTGASGIGAGGDPLKQAQFGQPWSMTFTPDNKFIYVLDNLNRRVVEIELKADGTAKYVTNIVGDRYKTSSLVDGIGGQASFANPVGIVALPVGKDGVGLWVTDFIANAIRQVR